VTHENDRERAYVVFQGGGALGVAHFGAWQAIARDFEIVGVAGTSSGSIIAALCAAGVDPDRAFESFKKNLPEIIGRKSFLWSLIDLISRALFGREASNDGSHFQSWLENQIKETDLEKGDTSFEELYQRKGIYLEVVACDLKDIDSDPVIFSSDVTRRSSVSRAVRASISLPGLFKTVRIGNREFVDGGFKLNFPIKNLYKLAKRDECAVIGVRFKKSPRSFKSSNIRQVFSKSYELVMSNSSPVPDEVKNYSKCKIIEIDDMGNNPLNFNLSEGKLLELREAGREAAEEQLEEFIRKIEEIKSKLYSRLSSNDRESVREAQDWFNCEAIPGAESACKSALRQQDILNLELDGLKAKRFYWEIRVYLTRVSESLLHEDYDLLEDRLLKLSLSNLTIYLEVLDSIKKGVPSYLTAREDIRNRIDHLKKIIIQEFGNNR